jgi:S1-C subfamily serine protease
VIEDSLPGAPDALDGLVDALDGLAFPTVFNDRRSPQNVVAPPETVSLAPELADRVTGSVLMVSGEACGFLQQGSGFAIERELVATAAHVVAGHETTRVDAPGQGSLPGTVVMFDPDADLALIHVPGLTAQPLALGEAELGEVGVVAGHPGGGALELSPFAVSAQVNAVGRDIYSNHEVERDVLVLGVVLEPGDSGAAVIAGAGGVIGLAFAASPDAAAVAYALSSSELRAGLERERGGADVSGCLTGG